MALPRLIWLLFCVGIILNKSTLLDFILYWAQLPKFSFKSTHLPVYTFSSTTPDNNITPSGFCSGCCEDAAKWIFCDWIVVVFDWIPPICIDCWVDLPILISLANPSMSIKLPFDFKVKLLSESNFIPPCCDSNIKPSFPL